MPIDQSLTLHERCLEAVVAEIIGLNLQGTSPPGNIGNQVFARNIPPAQEKQMPCIVCTIDGEQEEERDGNFEEIEVAYPVRGYILDRTTLDNADSKARKAYLSWRRLILNHFRRLQVLPGVAEFYNAEVSPRIILDSDLASRPAFQWAVSAFVIWCITMEPAPKPAQPTSN